MALFGRPTEQDQRRADQYRDWFRKRNPFALASAVLGIFSLIEFGALFIFGVAGAVLGIIALRQLHSARDQPVLDAPPIAPTHGHGLAWLGIITSVASLAIAVVIYTWPRE